MRIFAYGSNMSINRLRQRTPSAQKVMNAYVTGYRFAFNKFSIDDQSGKGNIMRTGNDQDKVWGVIFEIVEAEIGRLDSAEGGYHRIQIGCFDTEGQIHPTQTYIANENRLRNNIRPFDWYKQFVVTGALENDLPQNFVNAIEAMEATVDTDEERRQRNLNILNIT